MNTTPFHKIHKRAAFSNGREGGNGAGVSIVGIFPPNEEMLSIAAKLGYSETVFAKRELDGKFRTRYFSPENEVDFCGHATVALGAVLAEKFGAQTFSLTLTNADLAPDLPVAIANAGVDHVIIPLKSREELSQMKYDFDTMLKVMNDNKFITIALIYRENKNMLHVRNAFAFGGVVEDPATGAAAAAIGGYLRDLGALEFTNGQAKIDIHQGDDMGTPSRLHLTIGKTPNEGIQVGGTVRMLEG